MHHLKCIASDFRETTAFSRKARKNTSAALRCFFVKQQSATVISVRQRLTDDFRLFDLEGLFDSTNEAQIEASPLWPRTILVPA